MMFDDEHVPLLEKSFIDVRKLDHPNIIRYKALYLDLEKHLAYLVMELINLPSLLQYTSKISHPVNENVQCHTNIECEMDFRRASQNIRSYALKGSQPSRHQA